MYVHMRIYTARRGGGFLPDVWEELNLERQFDSPQTHTVQGPVVQNQFSIRRVASVIWIHLA